jgi:hypothetical protein
MVSWWGSGGGKKTPLLYGGLDAQTYERKVTLAAAPFLPVTQQLLAIFLTVLATAGESTTQKLTVCGNYVVHSPTLM